MVLKEKFMLLVRTILSEIILLSNHGKHERRILINNVFRSMACFTFSIKKRQNIMVSLLKSLALIFYSKY